jgi:glucose/arabinose dehydrogenase
MAWAWPSFLTAGVITDEQCRNDYMSSVVSMQAHSAPLGITFYDWKQSEDIAPECDGTAFPEEMNGFAFIAFHGSWNRNPPTGYKVVYVPMDDNGDAIGEPLDLLAHEGQNTNWEDGFRPVDVDFDGCGRLLVTSDGTNGNGKKIVRIDYRDPGVNSTRTCNMPSCQEGGGGSSGSPGKRYAAWMLIAALFPLFFI